MSILDGVQQFSENMLAQLDLRIESINLELFRYHFEEFPQIIFPEPILELSSESVLVETWESGEPVSKYLSLEVSFMINRYTLKKDEVAKEIAKLGLDAYMKMMLSDHFVHADLHPGNILVRQSPNTLQLILLDVGLVAELSPTDAQHFFELFKAVLEGNGEYGAELMIKYARKPPKFPDKATEEQFKTEMGSLFAEIRTKDLADVEVGQFMNNILFR